MKHLYVPDCQVKPGVPTDHIRWLAHYAMDKLTNEDKIIFAGDFYDMPALSSYDKAGSKSFEGRRLSADLDAGHRAVETLHNIWHKRGFAPAIHITLGNHEHRLTRAINDSPALLEGMNIDFRFKAAGWKVHDFLAPVKLNGILYSHYFPHNARGGVMQTKNGAPSAEAQAQRQMCSATAGHQQGFDYAVLPTPTGWVQGLIAGSFYLHKESYMQGLDNYWRGLVLKHNVRRGMYSLCQVEMDFLKQRYGKIKK